MTDAQEEIIQIEGELQEAESHLGDTLSDVSASMKAAVDQVRLGLRPVEVIRNHPVGGISLACAFGLLIGSSGKTSAIGPAILVGLAGFAISKRSVNSRAEKRDRNKKR
jgi:hypothetical protein